MLCFNVDSLWHFGFFLRKVEIDSQSNLDDAAAYSYSNKWVGGKEMTLEMEGRNQADYLLGFKTKLKVNGGLHQRTAYLQ
jgi:hypothetical protein